jgi:hypothetical protein
MVYCCGYPYFFPVAKWQLLGGLWFIVVVPPMSAPVGFMKFQLFLRLKINEKCLPSTFFVINFSPVLEQIMHRYDKLLILVIKLLMFAPKATCLRVQPMTFVWLYYLRLSGLRGSQAAFCQLMGKVVFNISDLRHCFEWCSAKESSTLFLPEQTDLQG